MAKSLLIRQLSQVVTPLRDHPQGHWKIHEKVSLYIKEGFIEAIDAEERLYQRYPELKDQPQYDGEGKIALPGFIDPHTHLPFIGWREGEFHRLLHGETYEDIAKKGGGILSTVQKVRQATPEALLIAVGEHLQRFLSHGVTTLEAKSGYGLTCQDELKQLRVLKEADRTHPITIVPTFLPLHALPPEYADSERYVKEVIEGWLPQVVEENLAVYGDVFCEEGFFPPRVCRPFLQGVKEAGLGIRIHAEELHPSGGAILAGEFQAASADHLDYITPEGIEALKKSGVVAVCLPGVNLFLRHRRLPPARKLLDAGIPVALSTDFNPGSCPTPNMLMIMRLGCFLLEMTLEEALAACTYVPALSLGLAEDRGTLEVGKRGDVTLWKVSKIEDLFYHFGEDPLEATIILGEPVYENNH